MVVYNNDFANQYVISRIRSDIDVNSAILQAREQIDSKIDDIPLLWITTINMLTSKEVYDLWDREAADSVFLGLERIAKSSQRIDFPRNTLEHFFAAIYAYFDAMEGLSAIESNIDNDRIKTRLFRAPAYTAFTEGCLTQLYKFVRDFISQTTDSKTALQNKLGNLVNLLTKHGFKVCTKYVDVDLRNSINHGTYIIKDKETVFFYTGEGHRENHRSITDYAFDELNNNVADLAGGIIVGIIRLFIRYPEIYIHLLSQLDPLDFGRISSARFELSLPGEYCEYIEGRDYNRRQIEASFFIHHESQSSILGFCVATAIRLRRLFPEHDDYFIGFEGPRMMPGFIRFLREEIDAYLAAEISLEDFASAPYRRDQVLIWPSKEDDPDHEKYRNYTFKTVDGNGWKVRNIEDISTEHKKRYRADLYIELVDTSESIKNKVKIAIEIVRQLFNPPARSHQTKNGSMAADAVYLNVYIRYYRKKNRELFPDNLNYVLSAHYNAKNMKPIMNGGGSAGVWNALRKEKDGPILFAWNPKYNDLLKNRQ